MRWWTAAPPDARRDRVAIATLALAVGGVIYVFGPGWAAILGGLAGFLATFAWSVFAVRREGGQ